MFQRFPRCFARIPWRSQDPTIPRPASIPEWSFFRKQAPAGGRGEKENNCGEKLPVYLCGGLFSQNHIGCVEHQHGKYEGKRAEGTSKGVRHIKTRPSHCAFYVDFKEVAESQKTYEGKYAEGEEKNRHHIYKYALSVLAFLHFLNSEIKILRARAKEKTLAV